MTKINKQWLGNFLIFSSLSNERLVESLLNEATQAYFLRDKARQEKIGVKLIELSPRFEYIGRYYLMLSTPQEAWIQGNRELVREIELLVDKSPLFVREIAMNSLAGIQIYSNKIDKETSQILFESSALSIKSGNILNFIQAQSQFSLICSIKGNHRESLSVLRGLQPMVDKMGDRYSVVKSDFYNSVAYELFQLGNHDAAKRFASFAVNSPYLKLYPEWQQTALEINQALPEKSRIICPPRQVFKGYFNPTVFEEYLEKRAFFSEPIVRTLPIGEHETEPNLSIYSNHRRFAQILLSQNRDIAQKAMQVFLFGADEFSSKLHEKGTMLFETFFCSTGMYSPVSEHSIRYEYLGLFQDLIEEANALNKDEPAPPTPPGSTRMENAETRKTVRWLMPRLEKLK